MRRGQVSFLVLVACLVTMLISAPNLSYAKSDHNTLFIQEYEKANLAALNYLLTNETTIGLEDIPEVIEFKQKLENDKKMQKMYLRIFNHDKSKIKQMITKEIDGNPADVIIFEDNSFRILTRFIDSDNVKIGYDLAKEENYDFGTLATQTQTRYFYGLGNKQVKTEGKTYAPYLVSTSVLITDFRITSSSPYLEITDVSTAGTSATWPRTLHSVSCQIVTKTGSTVKSKGNYWYKITYDNGTVGDRTEEIRETITWHYSSLEGHYAKVYSEWIY